MKIFSSSGAIFTRRQVSVKAIRALFGSLASSGLHQDGREQPRTVERGQPEFFSHSGSAGRERISAGFRFGGWGRAKKGKKGRFRGFLAQALKVLIQLIQFVRNRLHVGLGGWIGNRQT
jgi:hypothetical protein